MENSLESLQHSPLNPRNISIDDFKALKRSIVKFGDLSGVIKNIRTGNLVGGNQRTRAFRQLESPQLVITKRFDPPNTKGTVARGYITLGDEQYAYREVDWDADFEQAANIAANRIQGDWNEDLLAEVMHGLTQEMRELTGNTQDEINKILEGVADTNTKQSFSVLIECSGEDHQSQVMSELSTQGYNVKAISK